jgi:tetraacyldisaccharide 4'-kinase
MWKVLLIPFSWLYGIGLRARHFLYDTGIIASKPAKLPTLVVGNLCAGGSGKTPHMLWFADWLSVDYKIATLSRGYGRKTSGFREVELYSEASDTGDEPLMLKKKLPAIPVAVCENRLLGIERIFALHPNLEFVLLDDAFQHRQLRPDTSVLLIPHSDLFGCRTLLPAGNQRDLWYRYKKADIVIVTRCPDVQDVEGKKRIIKALPDFPVEAIFRSQTLNGAAKAFDSQDATELNSANFPHCILVTGIAGGEKLKELLESKGIVVKHFEFSDHHGYCRDDVNKIMQASAQKHPIFTTGKDRVKIEVLLEPALKPNWYELLMELTFDREEDLKQLILHHVTKHKRSR